MGRFIRVNFILRNMVAFSAAVLVASFIAYYCLSITLSRKLGQSFSGAYFMMKSLNESTGLIVWFAMVLFGIVVSIFLLAIALFATHKVAGPLFRLESLVDSASRGNINRNINFRTRDQIKPLASALTRVFEFIGRREDAVSRLLLEIETVEQSLGSMVIEQDPGWTSRSRTLAELLDNFVLEISDPRKDG